MPDTETGRNRREGGDRGGSYLFYLNLGCSIFVYIYSTFQRKKQTSRPPHFYLHYLSACSGGQFKNALFQSSPLSKSHLLLCQVFSNNPCSKEAKK